LRHSDFSYKKSKNNSTLGKKQQPEAVVKLPLINQQSVEVSSSRRNSRVSLRSNSRRESILKTYSSRLSIHQMQQTHVQKFNIDAFLRRKNIDVISVPWHLSRAEFSRAKTNTLIDKIKVFFHENYHSGVKQSRPAGDESKVCEEKERTAAASRFENELIVNSRLNLNNTFYLRKLKNNYYDRKLWKCLVPNKEFNFYAENTARDYDSSEFNVLKPTGHSKRGRINPEPIYQHC
jgi:hypothetical protein